MAAYPSYGILLTSKIDPESKWRDDFADSGTQHSRQIRSTRYLRFTLEHSMTVAQFRALETTYTAGERDTYTLTYYTESPEVTYSVKFLAAPRIIRNDGGGRVVVRVSLRGTKD